MRRRRPFALRGADHDERVDRSLPARAWSRGTTIDVTSRSTVTIPAHATAAFVLGTAINSRVCA
jgi:hypothetical protein